MRAPRRAGRAAGFTMLDMMMAVAIAGLLAAVAVPRMTRNLAASRRTEAVLALNQIARAADRYFAAHGRYTDRLDQLDFTMDAGRQTAANAWQAPRYQFVVALPEGDDQHFQAFASGDIDGDAFVDLLLVQR